MLLIAALWFGISTPLVFLGAYFGYRKERMTTPVAVNDIPREVGCTLSFISYCLHARYTRRVHQIRPQPWYLQPAIAIPIGGTLPFGAVFIELFYILSNIWMSEVYYLFGFMLASFLLLSITCGEISILMCYFQVSAIVQVSAVFC